MERRARKRINNVLNRVVLMATILATTSAPLVVLAVDAPTHDLIRDNSSVFAWILGMALSSLGVIIVWYVKSGNDNNKQQWLSLNNHERRLSRLEGEHGVNHGRRASDNDC